MFNCLNFIEEWKLFQTNSWNIFERRDRIFVYHTPKFYPNLSGEHIEYSWGCENDYYRQLSLDKQKGKKNFKKSVQEAILRDHFSTKRVHMFYRPAHEYIIDYKPMSHIQTLVGLYIDLFTHIYIKRIYNAVKYFNTNRCAIDFIASSLDFLQK